MIQDTSLIDILEQIMKDNANIKVTPMAKKGIQEFVEAIKEIREYVPQHRTAEILEKLVKKIRYREYLVKEEGGEVQADEKYENIGQLINMAEKYVETGEDTLRQFLEEVALLSDISENEQ